MYYRPEIDIIYVIRKLTIANPDFDPDQWSLHDADILIRAGEMIKREIGEKEGKL